MLQRADWQLLAASLSSPRPAECPNPALVVFATEETLTHLSSAPLYSTLSTALQVYGDDADTALQRAQRLEQERAFNQATTWYRRAWLLAPERADLWLETAKGYPRMQMQARAEETLGIRAIASNLMNGREGG